MEITSSSATPRHHPPRARKPWYRDGRTIIPMIISVVALVVSSVLSSLVYTDQRNADREQSDVDSAAANTARLADAKLISFYPPSGNIQDETNIIVANLGAHAVTDVWLQVSVTTDPPLQEEAQSRSYSAFISLPYLPACHNAEVNAHAAVVGWFPDTGPAGAGSRRTMHYRWSVQAQSVIFWDASGRAWQLGTFGGPVPEPVQDPGLVGFQVMALRIANEVPIRDSGLSATPAKLTAAAGCV